MLSPDRLLAFGVTAFVVIVIPGPSVLFVVGRALASGRRVAVLTVLGNAVGEYVQVIAVAFGVGALAEQSVAAFTALKLVGGAYLVYLGVRTFRERKSLAAAIAAPVAERSDRRSFLQGLTVGATNPKTVVFLAAILPQFVSRAGGHVPARSSCSDWCSRRSRSSRTRCGRSRPVGSGPGSPARRGGSS